MCGTRAHSVGPFWSHLAYRCTAVCMYIGGVRARPGLPRQHPELSPSSAPYQSARNDQQQRSRRRTKTQPVPDTSYTVPTTRHVNVSKTTKFHHVITLYVVPISCYVLVVDLFNGQLPNILEDWLYWSLKSVHSQGKK